MSRVSAIFKVSNNAATKRDEILLSFVSRVAVLHCRAQNVLKTFLAYANQ